MTLRPSTKVRAATFFLLGGVTSTLFYWIVGLAAFLLAVIFSARFYTRSCGSTISVISMSI